MSRKSETHPADKFCQKILNRYPNAIKAVYTVRRNRANFSEDCDLPTALVTVIITGSTDERTMIRGLNNSRSTFNWS